MDFSEVKLNEIRLNDVKLNEMRLNKVKSNETKLNELNVQITRLLGQYTINSQVLNGNELYIGVNGENTCEVCTVIYNVLGLPLVMMFASDERKINGNFTLHHVFADRVNGLLLTVKTFISENSPEFDSVAGVIHAAAAYECEIRDMFGLTAAGHPGLKRIVIHDNWPEDAYPLRKDFDKRFKPPFVTENNESRFLEVEGEGAFEVPVGPVHAGIIEPGHFRFSVAGEPIINLEAQLSYVHRGLEKLSEDMSIEKCYYLSERISGDESFSNSLAYCMAVEKLADVVIPERADFTRVVFAELERLTSHLGDLAGICVDVAYGFAASQFRMMRGWSYLLADELCGRRFLRSVNKPGGLRRDFIAGKEKKIYEFIPRIFRELKDTAEIIKANSMFTDRVENTGILKNNIAVDLNAVGPVARASGVNIDVRRDFPYAAYGKLEFSVPEHANGDVNCRMNVKIEECFESIKLILQAVESMPSGRICGDLGHIEPFRYAFGWTESPRGENMHWVMAGENDTIHRYKIRTPSFCNWPALCHAVKGNIIPDFPLINKSFNLSYAGNDL